MALLLGVEFHEGVSFEGLLEPSASDNSESKYFLNRLLKLTKLSVTEVYIFYRILLTPHQGKTEKILS